eukprot:Lithocolla_globosa_v1_NODE_2095_length_2172_cov_26.194615.p2 type:complete len:193 gc:universal NODE_2095_length_2172_cov_26.194615:1738-1160(-)
MPKAKEKGCQSCGDKKTEKNEARDACVADGFVLWPLLHSSLTDVIKHFIHFWGTEIERSENCVDQSLCVSGQSSPIGFALLDVIEPRGIHLAAFARHDNFLNDGRKDGVHVSLSNNFHEHIHRFGRHRITSEDGFGCECGGNFMIDHGIEKSRNRSLMPEVLDQGPRGILSFIRHISKHDGQSVGVLRENLH